MAEKKQVSRKCSVKRCRAMAEVGSMCAKHAEKNDAVEQVMKMTETEALRFGKLDSDTRNCMQGIQLAKYEINNIRIEAQQRMEAQATKQKALEAQLEGLRDRYKPLVQELADKYKLDPARMLIDPESRIIREDDSKKD